MRLFRGVFPLDAPSLRGTDSDFVETLRVLEDKRIGLDARLWLEGLKPMPCEIRSHGSA